MKKIFTLFLVFMTSIPIVLSDDSWHDFEIDGIYYNKLGGDSVEVTYRGDDYLFRDDEYSGNVTIPAKADGYRVTAIGEEAFRKCETLTSVTIPNSVTSIGDRAFYDCSSLSSITIPKSVTSIGAYAFSDTPFYKNLPEQEGQIYVGSVLYEVDDIWYKNKDTLEIREGTVGITDFALDEYNRYVKCVIIPNSVIKIGHRSFNNISSIIVKSGNKIYDSRDNCNAIIETATNTLVYGIKTSKIPNSVTSIGEYAFNDCNLKKVKWNAINCESFGSRVFKRYSWDVPQIKEFTFGDSVQFIPNGLCSGLEFLTSVIIPNSVKSIGSNSFYHCSSLSSIIIPESVNNIGEDAFHYCENLKTIYCFAKTPPTIALSEYFTFDYIETIYVPKSSIDDYKSK